jgi:hypothetical protein
MARSLAAMPCFPPYFGWQTTGGPNLAMDMRQGVDADLSRYQSGVDRHDRLIQEQIDTPMTPQDYSKGSAG